MKYHTWYDGRCVYTGRRGEAIEVAAELGVPAQVVDDDEWLVWPERPGDDQCALTFVRGKHPTLPSKTATARVTNPLPVPDACPYCSSSVKLVCNRVIYGSEYGDWPFAYRCTHTACGAYVGLHPFTAIPLGTLANAATRDARKAAKEVFGQVVYKHRMDRTEAYRWLARTMGLDVGECHFGWFDEPTCMYAYAVCRAKMEEPAPRRRRGRQAERAYEDPDREDELWRNGYMGEEDALGFFPGDQ